MKKLKESEQWLVYKAFLEELKTLNLCEKLPDIYVAMLSDYRIDEELNRVEQKLIQTLCEHGNTKKRYSRDSHYDYEDIYCDDCGKEQIMHRNRGLSRRKSWICRKAFPICSNCNRLY